MNTKKDADYSLFSAAMDEFSKLARVSLEALRPYKDHSGTCTTACPSCRLKRYFWKIDKMCTEVKP